MNWTWKKPDSSMVTVWIKWRSGVMQRTVPFWMPNDVIIREAKKALLWVEEQMTVDRKC